MIEEYEYLLKKAEETGLKEILDLFIEKTDDYKKFEKIVRKAEDSISSRPKVTVSSNSYY